MTELKRKVSRTTKATVFERSKQREVVISLEPPNLIGFRLKGNRRTFYLEAASCYTLAVKAALRDEEKQRPRKGKRRAR